MMNLKNRRCVMVTGSSRSVNSSSLGLTIVCSIMTPSRQRRVGHLEELVVAVAAEVLERADRHDAVDRLVELLPALQQHSLAARAVQLVESCSTWACWLRLRVRPTTLTS